MPQLGTCSFICQAISHRRQLIRWSSGQAVIYYQSNTKKEATPLSVLPKNTTSGLARLISTLSDPLVLNVKQESCCEQQHFSLLIWLDEGIKPTSIDYEVDTQTITFGNFQPPTSKCLLFLKILSLNTDWIITENRYHPEGSFTLERSRAERSKNHNKAAAVTTKL